MSQIEFAAYVVERLKQCGVKQVFGVPGDFNLELLDFIEKDPDLHWVGNANELNAAYAADGYARIKGTLAVIITTFGVGELSALCGIAGTLAERVPVLHIVGSPSSKMQSGHSLLHHTLNLDSSFETFSQMSAPLSTSQALLSHTPPSSPTSWTDAFDKVVRDVLEQCRPGYVEIPTDAVHRLVSAEGLKTPPPHPHSAPPIESIASSLPVQPGKAGGSNTLSALAYEKKPTASSDDVTEHVVGEITKLFAASKEPIVLVDACCGRFGMAGEVRKLVEGCGVRFFSTPMGKSLLDEHHPLYGGCYAGANSLDPVRQEVESADFALYVGALKSDFNSGSFSVNIDPKVIIELHSFTTTIGYASYPTTDIRHILPLLVPSFAGVVSSRPKEDKKETIEEKQSSGVVEQLLHGPEGSEIKHDWFWPRMGSWFQDRDIIITETGTSSFGLTNVPLPSHSTYVAQILWGAIGWSVGAALGCVLAAKEDKKERRTVLFVGDGSLQLTLQEIGTMLRRGTCPYLFVLNNDGYEIERQIHGWTAEYNDIQLYDHQLLLPFLAGKKCKVSYTVIIDEIMADLWTPYESIAVYTPEELDALLKDKNFAKPDKLRLIEVYMPRGDAPKGLVKQAKLTAEANAKA